jgi:uncharacterized protein YprB with RNaseH-like and TPR domain
MLPNTFRHIAGIGDATERALWDAGATTWDLAGAATSLPLPQRLLGNWKQQLCDSAQELGQGNIAYFAGRLPPNQHWRLFRDFQDACAFLDIETTGQFGDCDITTIALYDGRDVRHYVRGKNLDHFSRDVERYKLLVTYNGKSFDVPTIRRCLGTPMPQAHIDLCPVLRSLGLKGGLKGCERKLGLRRPGMEDMDGMMAVFLWDEYRRHNNPAALATLLAYNCQDALVLHTLVVHAYNEKISKTPFADALRLPAPVLPENPFPVDRGLVDRLILERFSVFYPLFANDGIPPAESQNPAASTAH